MFDQRHDGFNRMVYLISVFVLPALLIFGVYHLALWFHLFGIQRCRFWRRVALASAVSHVLLVVGFFAFTYLSYVGNLAISAGRGTFELFLLSDTAFWRLGLIFDTVATATLLGVFGALDRLDWNPGATIPLIVGLLLVVGTVQWYWIGAALGAAFERIWSGLKTPDDELPSWF